MGTRICDDEPKNPKKKHTISRFDFNILIKSFDLFSILNE